MIETTNWRKEMNPDMELYRVTIHLRSGTIQILPFIPKAIAVEFAEKWSEWAKRRAVFGGLRWWQFLKRRRARRMFAARAANAKNRDHFGLPMFGHPVCNGPWPFEGGVGWGVPFDEIAMIYAEPHMVHDAVARAKAEYDDLEIRIMRRVVEKLDRKAERREERDRIDDE